MSISKAEIEHQKQVLFRWQSNIDQFIEEVLGIDGTNGFTMTTQQREGAKEISKIVNAKRKKNVFHEPLTEEEEIYAKKIGISIMSGQGPGKDALCAWTVIWLLFCFRDVLIPCTAPGADQLKNILWAEVTRWLNKVGTNGKQLCAQIVKDTIVVQVDKIYNKEYNGKVNFAMAKTANPKDDPEAQAKTLYGLHEKYMMIVCEEAAGIQEAVFKPIEGTLTGAVNFIFMPFNPIFDKGFAYESQYGANSDKWVALHWDARESEMVSKDHIQGMIDKYGLNSNTVRTLVIGLPPQSSPDALIPKEWVYNAIHSEIVSDKNDLRIAGFDPGAGGDNSVLIIRTGRVVDGIHVHSSPDTNITTDWLVTKAIDEGIKVLYIGSIGIGNAIYFGAKRRLQGRCKVYQIKENWKAKDEERFTNRRNELWWKGREAFEEGSIKIPDNAFLKEELSTPRFKHTGKRIEVDNKHTMKKTLGATHSPNHADAFIFTLDKEDYTLAAYAKAASDHDDDEKEKQPVHASWMRA